MFKAREACVCPRVDAQVPKGLIERTEDFETKPHKAFTLRLRKMKRFKTCVSLQCQNLCQVTMPESSKVEGGKEKSEEEDEVRPVEREVMNAVLATLSTLS